MVNEDVQKFVLRCDKKEFYSILEAWDNMPFSKLKIETTIHLTDYTVCIIGDRLEILKIIAETGIVDNFAEDLFYNKYLDKDYSPIK